MIAEGSWTIGALDEIISAQDGSLFFFFCFKPGNHFSELALVFETLGFLNIQLKLTPGVAEFFSLVVYAGQVEMRIRRIRTTLFVSLLQSGFCLIK